MNVAATKGTAGLDVLAAARAYAARGFAVVPLPPRQKAPVVRGWPNLRLAADNLERAFSGAGGVGILCGGPSGGLADVDLDDAHARTAWQLVGPATDMRHGRASAVESHAWYRLDAPPPKTERLEDPDGSTLVELRWTGTQTAAPPSLHPSGEELVWHAEGEPAQVPLVDLQRATRKCAAIAMLARRWPEGSRHTAALALAGVLLRGGMRTDEAERFVELVAAVAGDPEVTDRARAARDTAAAIAQGERATGGATLAQLLREGDRVLRKLREWLELPAEPVDGVAGPRALDLAEFLRVEFPPRENIMEPVFPRQGLGMVHAWRGLGKTHFTLSFALSVAAGASFLKWHAPRPCNVLYVDGEMRGVDMQTRLAKTLKGTMPRPEPSRFRIITPDLQERGIPDLGTHEGQRWLDAELADRDLIVLDNLSSLVRTGTDKEDDVWLPLLDWLLRLRASGRAALLVHHDGKNNTQRGTSRREDQLDTVFHLLKPKDYRESDGARFVLHFEKHRGFHGRDADPFEAALIERAGVFEWVVSEPKDELTEQVAELLREGSSVTEITKTLKIGRATVDRHKRKAIARGLYDGR